MLDRVWFVWQMQDPENRINAIPGQTGSMGGMPGMNHMLADIRPEMNAQDVVNQKKRDHMWKRNAEAGGEVIVELGWTGPAVNIKNLLDQLGGIDGQMCYIYV